MGINTATQKFKEDLINVINNSGLPSCIVEMVLGNTLEAVRRQLALDLQKEREVEADGKSI